MIGGQSLRPNGGHFVHRNSKGAVTGKTDDRNVRAANLCAQNGREPVSAGTKEAGCQIFASFIEGRIGVADGTIVADVGRNDCIFRQYFLDGAPGHARAHAVGLAVTGAFVPVGARIVVLVIH